MRKVLFKKWIAKEVDKTPAGDKTKKGTNCWEEDFTNEGLFHQWAFAYEEFTPSVGNFTIAIIELADGTIVEVLPSNIKFIETKEL